MRRADATVDVASVDVASVDVASADAASVDVALADAASVDAASVASVRELSGGERLSDFLNPYRHPNPWLHGTNLLHPGYHCFRWSHRGSLRC